MKKVYLSLLLLTVFSLGTMRAQWTNVGSPDFTGKYAGSSSVAFDASGIPYVAFSDGSQAGKATVMKYSGGSWQVVGSAGFSVGSVTGLTLELRGSTPVVAFADAGNSGKATAMKLNGSNTWVNVGSAGFSAGAAYNTTVAIDSIGYVYVAYTDAANNNKATVMNYNGSSWVALGSAGFTAAAASYPAMIIKHNVPYIIYSDASAGGNLTVMGYNGGSWAAEGNAGFGGNAGSTCIAADNTGTLYAAGSLASSGGDVVAFKLESGTWTALGTSVSSGAAQSPQIAIDANNVPYIAYQDYAANASKATVMKYTGSAWQTVGAAGFTPGKAYDISLAIGPGNAPYVAFADYTDSNKISLMTFGGTASVNNTSAAEISVYPNPVNSELTINCPSPISGVTIYDLNGRVVLEERQPANNHFDISNFTNGFYLVKITSEEQVYTRKIVKD
jgi:Secretion system C-terminal sorting domain